MIPVTLQPAPEGFEENVRTPGLNWLRTKGISIDTRAPKVTKFNALWTNCIDYAHEKYGGLCAYLATYLELATGEVTIDHFESKMAMPGLAYEWTNYRLASLGINRIKDEQIVLDPFEVQEDWFRLELVSGKVFANPELPENIIRLIDDTISKLKLDNARCRKLRAQHFKDYKDLHYGKAHLKKINPLVFKEAARQDLL